MRHVMFMVGAPASGKSTLARQIQLACTEPGEDPQDCVPILSLDAFRHMMCPTHHDTNGQHVLISGANRKSYMQAYLDAVEAHMRVGATMILDNTHTVLRNIRDAYELAAMFGYEVTFCRLTADRDTLAKRDAYRRGSHHVGEAVINRMLAQLETLDLDSKSLSRCPHRTIDVNAADIESFPDIAAAIGSRLRLDVSVPVGEGETCVIVGDVHANAERLAALKHDIDATGTPTTIVFAGDLFDRGTDTVRTMFILNELRREHRCIFVEGNHDWHMKRLLAGDERARGRFGETAETYDELTAFTARDLLQDMRQITKSMVPAALICRKGAKYLVTHAGIAPSIARRIAETGLIEPHVTVADCVYGCGTRDQLYNKAHPSSYDRASIEAADGFLEEERVVQVHGHRPEAGAHLDPRTHIDLETGVWTPEGCLSALWITPSEHEEVRRYR